MVDGRDCGYLGNLGFHPYKEIVFLNVSLYRGLAYHLKDSKVEDLGYLYPTSCYESLRHECFIKESYPYMACWTSHQNATLDVEGHTYGWNPQLNITAIGPIPVQGLVHFC